MIEDSRGPQPARWLNFPEPLGYGGPVLILSAFGRLLISEDPFVPFTGLPVRRVLPRCRWPSRPFWVMDLRSVFAPSCTLSLHKSFLQGVELQPCLQYGTGFNRLMTKCCQHPICGGLKTEVIEDSTLVDIQESSDGYVLFKFGTTQLYDDPQRFISSVAQAKLGTCVEAGTEVIDCSAVVHRLPNEDSAVGSYPWNYHTDSLADGSSSTSSFVTSSYENGAEVPRLTFGSSKLPDVSLDFIGPRSFADHLVSAEVRNESFARFLRSSNFVTSAMKLLPANISFENVSTESSSLGPGAVQSVKTSTVRRVNRTGKKSRAHYKRPTRDLYRSSSFQIYELIFRYPFMDSNKTSSTWKEIPKEKYTELFGVLNQIAIGLAGSGLALVLFVASRMLCLNATLDSLKLMSLMRGVGLLWLSSALQKFGSVVKLMAECGEKARSERKEHLAMLRKEVHSVTFKLTALPCEKGRPRLKSKSGWLLVGALLVVAILMGQTSWRSIRVHVKASYQFPTRYVRIMQLQDTQWT